jgi:hypothetical protein
MNETRPGVLRLISHMLAAVFNSRSAFNAQWKAMETQPCVADGIAGRWTGEWISQRTGHRGQLRCVLIPISSELCRAYFHAAFSKLFRVAYITELKVDRMNGRTQLKGEEDLGNLAGGVYRSTGEITGSSFDCHYSCKYDEGVFRLKRLE